MRNIIASLDLGSQFIKLVVGEIQKNKLNVLASISVPSRGIKGGFIVNVESASEAIKETFDKASSKIGYKIEKVIINAPSYQTSSFVTTAQNTVGGEIINNKIISDLLKKSIENKITSNYKLVALTPTFYVINDSQKVKNPNGITAEKLAVKAVGNVIPKKNTNLIIKTLKNIGIEVIDCVVNPISDFYQFADQFKIEHSGAVVNIGAAKTEVSIFNKGILTSCETLSVGGLTIDQALAYYYKITKNDAIYLKEKLVTLDLNVARAGESITFDSKNNEQIKINQYDASEIAINKVIEMLNLIKKQINYLTKKEISYIIVTGGLTQISDFEFLLDEVFNRKATIANVTEIGIRDNRYSSAAGLIKYYNNKLKFENKNFSILSLSEQEEFSAMHKKVNVSGNSALGKLLGIFYDS